MIRNIFVVLGVSILASPSPGQTLLYDNGPVNGQNTAYSIEGYIATDSFTLAADSTVTNATIGTWTYPGYRPASLQWSITTEPLGGTTLASATVTPADTFLVWNSLGAYVYSDSFSVTPTELAAGTYWFQLSDASTGGNSPVFWDVNNGPSLAYASGVGSIPSESFQLFGTINNVPEPSTVALVLVGGLSLACLRFRK